jgi:hypothetical protein
MRIDLSLKNTQLYAGCSVEVVAGRDNLTTPVSEAVNLVGANIEKMLADIPVEDRREVVLTGPMAVWAYLVVFHAVVHRFDRVWYEDGRNPAVLIAAHG